jgi:hypothetical protein
MSNLNKETIEKIKERAKDYALNLTFPLTWSSERVEGARDDAANDYEAAATEWAGKAQGLADALQKVSNIISWMDREDKYCQALREVVAPAIAKYKEVSNEKK